CARGDPFAYW
nr:immunoglobulin heavy chain junction region [Mus musculus]NSM08810.1 immunoglobulin heavy chain junction region [Mus musculus]